MTRKCTACGVVKPLDCFYGGRVYTCKPCHSARDATRKDRSGPRDNTTDAAKARKRRWMHKVDPAKQAARLLVRNAIQSGYLVVRHDCETCGESPRRSDGARAVQAHHDDYSKPLDVRWLCTKCHSRWHREHDAAMSELVPVVEGS